MKKILILISIFVIDSCAHMTPKPRGAEFYINKNVTIKKDEVNIRKK